MASSPSISKRRDLLPWIARLAALLAATAVTSARGQSAQDLEYRVKAAILYNVARFVEWPDSASAGPHVFCVLGDDPFGEALDNALRGKRINNRPVLLRRYRNPQDVTGCHVLFISASESRRVKTILRTLGTSPVLTISELPRFANDGGIVNFIIEDGKVRFEVNVQAAEQAGLRISSQLLDLARIVKPGNGGKG